MYSPSVLQTYADCAHAYYLLRKVKAPRREAVWFVQGTAVHSALEAYERSFRRLEVGDVVRAYEDAWRRELSASQERQREEKMWMVGGRKKLAEDIETRFEMGREQVVGYVTHNPASARLRPAELVPGEAAVEVGFELNFGEFRVRGYIDYIMEDQETGALYPMDVKTGSRMPVNPFQLATYGIAVTELTGEPVEWAGYWDCRNNKRHDVQVTNFDHETVRNWYRQLHNGIKAESFLPNPGDGCFVCPVRPSCIFAQ